MGALDTTLGALYIGVVIAAVLYGCTCIQTWFYYTHYPTDPWYNKVIVALVLLSDTGHQILITHVVYTYCITDFGQYNQLTKLVWSIIVEVYFNAFTTLFVQCYLGMRVYKLTKSLLATGLVAIFILAQFVASTAFSSKAITFDTFAQLATLRDLSRTVNALAAAGDIIIAALLCVALHRSRTGFRRSETLINKMLTFTINTGALTSLDALASLICITAWPKTFIYVTFYFCIGRLYCNSLLATLNARKALRAGGSSGDDIILEAQSRGGTMFGTSTTNRVPNNISVKIDTTHEYVRGGQSGADKGILAFP